MLPVECSWVEVTPLALTALPYPAVLASTICLSTASMNPDDIDLSARVWKNRKGTTWRAVHRPTQIALTASWSNMTLPPQAQAAQVLALLQNRVTRATEAPALPPPDVSDYDAIARGLQRRRDW